MLDVRRAIFALEDDYREPLVLQVLIGLHDRRDRGRARPHAGRGADAAVPGAAEAARAARPRGDRGGGLTMECLEFRRAAGADPGHLSAEAARAPRRLPEVRRVPAPDAGCWTRRSWPRCACRCRKAKCGWAAVIADTWWRSRGSSAVAGWRSRPASRAACSIGSLLWVSGPRASLAEDVVKHMAHEPGVMVMSSAPEDASKVAARDWSAAAFDCGPVPAW